MRRHASRERSDGGASLIEFAIILPLLVMMLLGIIEFGWAFAQNLEVKHIAREVGRLVTVGEPEAVLDARACSGTIAEVTDASMSPGSGSTRDSVDVTITASLQQITGFFSWALGDVDNVSSTVEVRLEQDAAWGGTSCP